LNLGNRQRPYLPDNAGADADFRRLISDLKASYKNVYSVNNNKRYLKLSIELEEEFKNPLWQELEAGDVLDPTTWDESWFEGLQQKYIRSARDKLSSMSYLGEGLVRCAFGLHYDVLPEDEKWTYRRVVYDMGLHLMSNSELIVACRKLSKIAIHHGPTLFGSAYMCVTHLETFFGAPPITESSQREFRDGILAWVSVRKPEDNRNHGRSRLISHGLEKLKEVTKISSNQRTMTDFLLHPSEWLSSGASDEDVLPETRANKFSTYASMSLNELKTLMLDDSPPVYKAQRKRERGKEHGRHFINSPMSLFMQMSFVGQGFEESNLGPGKSIPGTKAGVTVEEWLNFCSFTADYVSIPIDQSTFDEVPSMDAVLKAVDIIIDCSANDPERVSVANIIKKRLANGIVDLDGELIEHKRGILSGWRWTSVIGSMINFAEILAITETVGVSLNGRSKVQGDDAQLFVHSWDDAVSIIDEYMRWLPVNPGSRFLALRLV